MKGLGFPLIGSDGIFGRLTAYQLRIAVKFEALKVIGSEWIFHGAKEKEPIKVPSDAFHQELIKVTKNDTSTSTKKE
jgi:hypothetical protein